MRRHLLIAAATALTLSGCASYRTLITADPADAEILVDGVPKGTRSVDVELGPHWGFPSQHVLTLRRQAGPTFSTTIHREFSVGEAAASVLSGAFTTAGLWWLYNQGGYRTNVPALVTYESAFVGWSLAECFEFAPAYHLAAPPSFLATPSISPARPLGTGNVLVHAHDGTERLISLPEEKSPWFSAGSSLFISGTGQMWNGDWPKAGLFLGGALATSYALNSNPSTTAYAPWALVGLQLGSAWDGYAAAQSFNARRDAAVRQLQADPAATPSLSF